MVQLLANESRPAISFVGRFPRGGQLNKPGIYAIQCIADGKGTTYIGQARRPIRKRFYDHRWELMGGKHHNSHLQNAWNLYGLRAFIFVVLENTLPGDDVLVQREQFWLDRIRETYPVYNWGKIAKTPASGMHHSEESRRKMSVAKKGNVVISEEQKKKHSESMRGRIPHNKGKPMPEWWKDKLRTSPKAIAAREKLFARKVGKPRPEWLKKILSEKNQRPYPTMINTHTLEIIPAGMGLLELCRRTGLKRSGMQNVASGKTLQNKGWILYDIASIL